MSTEKITKRIVAAAEARPQRYIIFDNTVPGFGLRVYPSGAKSWVFEYRPGEGGRSMLKKRVTIGTTADFTVEAARKEADRLRAVVKTGGDPQGDKATRRAAPNLGTVATAFMEQHVDRKRSASTAASYQQIFDSIVLPKLGNKKAMEITGRDMSALHQQWAGAPYQANKALAVVSALYGWASGPVALVPEGINPARGIERFTEERRGQVLSTEELVRLGTTIRAAETAGIPWKLRDNAKVKHRAKDEAARVTVIGEHAAAALRLLIFTGARLREILNLRWDQIDFEQGIIVLAKHKSSRTTGAKAIVLNAPALEVLTNLSRVGVYVIAGASGGQKDEKPRSDLKRPWELVRRHAGLDTLRIHDLRHNFGGFGAGGGMGLPIIGKLLGHTQPSTTARYSHLDNDPVRKASNTIGAALAAAMGEPTARRNNVVAMSNKLR